MTAVLVLHAVPPAFATTPSAVINAINAERTARGLVPLQAYGDNSMAKRSNDAFVATGALHGRFQEASSFYRSAGATSVAENQARFPASSASGTTVAKAWADSKGHAANQFDPKATHVAAAVASSGGDVYYTVHIVAASSHKPPAKQPEPAPTPPKSPPPTKPPSPPPPAPVPQAAPVAPAAPPPPVEAAEVEPPRVIPTPRQMLVLEPVFEPVPATPAQLRPEPAPDLDIVDIQARVFGLLRLPVMAGVGEVARVAEVIRAAEVARAADAISAGGMGRAGRGPGAGGGSGS